MEAFVNAQKLENIRDWKSFITSYLLKRGEKLMGIMFSHHISFYIENGVPRVQYKHFNKDMWGLTKGHICL